MRREEFMRRKDREIVEATKILKIIADCYCLRIGYNDNGHVYIVPVNFGHTVENNTHIFFFHGAKQGRKYDLAQNNPCVGFELDTGYAPIRGEIACNYGSRYQSIIGEGTLTILTHEDERINALLHIMKQNTQKADWTFAENMLEKTAVFKLQVNSMQCKEHL